MDLSINNVNVNKKNITFKGLEGGYSTDAVPVFRFVAPPHDHKKERVILESVDLRREKGTINNYLPPSLSKIVADDFPLDSDVLIIPQKEFRDLSSAFAYRYNIVDRKTGEHIRYELDPFKSMVVSKKGEKEERMNVIEQGQNLYGISPKGGTMRHSFLDSDVRIDSATGKRAELNKDFIRNHFAKLGGSIAGLNWLLKSKEGKSELEPYGYLMTTPDIGVDKVSSHRYWPSNHYQCSDLGVFKDFNFELFKQGKGYIADGAFTSQGIQSPLVQHVLKWGEKSPFYHMLKIDDQSTIALGILPDYSEGVEDNPINHIGVRVVNHPDFSGYDSKKATYIQFYDDRLMEEETIKSNELQFNYDKIHKDHYEISSHQDSVQPYAFEIVLDETEDPKYKERLAVFKDGKNHILLKDIKDGYQDFLTFPNFAIESKANVAGASCWDGNVDIIKMNLSNPTRNAANEQGYRQAREYLFGVADYWTETIQSHLILETAKLGNGKGTDEKPTKLFVAEQNGVDEKLFNDIKANLSTFNSLVLDKGGKTAIDYIQKFPLQTLETSEELSAVFAQPQFSKEFLTESTRNKLIDIVDKTVDSAIPEKFKGNKSYKAYVLKTYANEILRQVLASALNKDAVKDGEINLEELKKVTLRSIDKAKSANPQEERASVISKLHKGISSSSVDSLADRMKKEIEHVTLEDFKLAEAVVLQGKGGLNWRFDAAKDIGDLDAVRDGEEFRKIWDGSLEFPGVQAFWTEFVSRIKKYNPSAYIINEVTSLGEFVKMNDPQSRKDFDPHLEARNAALPKKEREKYENKVVYQKQVQFLDMTNSTTTSEYSKGFNTFSEFAGVNPEKISSMDSKAGNLRRVKNIMDDLMNYNQPNSAMFSHMFVSNHDKPSILHTLPLDMNIFLAGDLEKLVKEDDKKLAEIIKEAKKEGVEPEKYTPLSEKIDKLTGGRTDYNSMSAKAIGVGLAMTKAIDKVYPDTKSKENIALKKSLENLVNGKKKSGGDASFKRAENFGVKPFEVTIVDLLENAGMEANQENVLNLHHALLGDSMTYFERLWQVMNACVGTPAIYGGTEFAQTGYETPSKNVYLGIRNEVLRNLIAEEGGDDRYKAYFNSLKNTSGLYKNPKLSALRNGTPISCQMSGDPIEYDKIIDGAKKDAVNALNEKFEAELQQGSASETALTLKKVLDGINKGQKPEDIDKLYNDGKVNYLAEQVYSYLQKQKIDVTDENLAGMLAELAELSDEEFAKVVTDDYKISENDNNIDFFRYAQEEVMGVVKAMAQKSQVVKDETMYWPVYKYDSKGSKVLSIVTNLGLPVGKPSFEVESSKAHGVVNKKGQILHSVKSIEIKDKNDHCPFEEGTSLTKVGDDKANYVIKNGKIQRKDGKNMRLTDTVSTFHV